MRRTMNFDSSGTALDETNISRTIQRAFVNASGSGNTQVVAAQGGAIRIRVLAVVVIATLAVTVKFQSNITDISAGFPVGANGGCVLPYNPHGWFQTVADDPLNINLGVGTSTGCQITWVQAT